MYDLIKPADPSRRAHVFRRSLVREHVRRKFESFAPTPDKLRAAARAMLEAEKRWDKAYLPRPAGPQHLPTFSYVRPPSEASCDIDKISFLTYVTGFLML